jgi:hypothetical protein
MLTRDQAGNVRLIQAIHITQMSETGKTSADLRDAPDAHRPSPCDDTLLIESAVQSVFLERTKRRIAISSNPTMSRYHKSSQREGMS